jgi:hypothetical protein
LPKESGPRIGYPQNQLSEAGIGPVELPSCELAGIVLIEGLMHEVREGGGLRSQHGLFTIS